MTNFEKWYDKIRELSPVSDSICAAIANVRMMACEGCVSDQAYYSCPYAENPVDCFACEQQLLKWLYEDSGMPDFDNLEEGIAFSCNYRFKVARQTFTFVHKYGDTLWLIKDDHGDLWKLDKFKETFTDFLEETR